MAEICSLRILIVHLFDISRKMVRFLPLLLLLKLTFHKLDILMITYSNKAIEASCESADLIQAVIFCHCLPCFVTYCPREKSLKRMYTKIKMIPFLELHFNGYNKALVT